MLKSVQQEQFFTMPQYPEFEGDMMQDGYHIRKMVESIAFQAKVMPHMLNEPDDDYVKSFHRFTANNFFEADVDVVSNKINEGLNNLIAMHQEAYDFVRQFANTDEGKRVRAAVSQNIEAVTELKQKLKEIIHNIKTL